VLPSDEFVHIHEYLVRFPTVTGIIESGSPDVELQGGSSITVAAVSKDRLSDEFLLVLLSYSQRIIVDGIVCSDPLVGH